MSSKKNLQKELKQPDKFQTQVFEFSDWASKNKQQIKMAIYPIIGIFVLIFGYQAFQSYQTEGRRAGLAIINIEYNAEEEVAQKKRTELNDQVSELTQKETKAKLAAITKKDPKKSAKKDEKEDDKKVADKKPEEKIDLVKIAVEKKALRDQIKGIKPDHSKSKEMFLKYFSANMSYPEGWNAGLRVANIQLENKEYKEAAENVSKVLDHAKDLDFYQIQVRVLYVSILEELERYDDALKELDVLVKSADEDTQPKLLLTKGRIEILKNQKTEAYATFKGLIAKHGTSREATKARTIMALWN